jgi:hypothetical protein
MPYAADLASHVGVFDHHAKESELVQGLQRTQSNSCHGEGKNWKDFVYMDSTVHMDMEESSRLITCSNFRPIPRYDRSPLQIHLESCLVRYAIPSPKTTGPSYLT